ncbi:hypothetical protein B0H13DRAFT_1916479 [Mycena leptocephala]|nr:hypothetical protein B0H13DRAFT_1916479 [Mycena leptocephala]
MTLIADSEISLPPAPPMVLKLVLRLAAVALAGFTSIAPDGVKLEDTAQMPFDMPVFTATRVHRTITDVPPYIADRTTMTWTCVEPHKSTGLSQLPNVYLAAFERSSSGCHFASA